MPVFWRELGWEDHTPLAPQCDVVVVSLIQKRTLCGVLTAKLKQRGNKRKCTFISLLGLLDLLFVRQVLCLP